MAASTIIASTLVGLLRARASGDRAETGYTYLADGEVETERLDFAALDRRARAIGARLQQGGLAGERVLLLFPPGLDFVAGFFGCLYAGAVAVPTYPPRPGRGQPRLSGIVREARPRAVLTTSALLAGEMPEMGGADWIAADTLDPDFAEYWQEPVLGADSLAFLQYTSGSTADPKGVMVTHGNLLDNQEAIRRAFGQSAESVVVGWLPLYHDMGLIGTVLQPLYVGARCVLMSPLAFLQRPVRWLEAISRYRATTSGGPNFAYDLCVRRVGAERLHELDLSSWRVAFNGAEPVRAGTLDRFAEHFAPCGFRRQAFQPCYGLAEATLFVASPPPEAAPTVASGEEGGRPLVGCGHPFLDHRVAIVDPESRTLRPEGGIGEIWVGGASVAQGYWGRPEESREVFGVSLADGGGPFLRTGDLGFLRGGELFVTGRLKDLIILRGRNHHPHDIELTAEQSHAALRPGCSAAFSVEAGGEERLVIVCEVERGTQDAPVGTDEVIDAVRQQVAAEHEVQAYAVVLAPPGTVPKTSSGKIRRSACRALYLAGDLEAVARSVLGSAPEAAPAPDRRTALEAFLRESAARALEVPAEGIDPRRPLTSLGLDSLAAAEIGHDVESRFGVVVSPLDLLEGQSLADLVELLLKSAKPVEAPERAADVREAPLSHGQEALWFLDRLAPGDAAYVLAGAVRLKGDLDIPRFERALTATVERHGALRTVFSSREGRPFQRVAEAPATGWLRVEDASAWSGAELRVRLAEEAWRPFDLEHGALRVRIYQGRGQSVVLFAVHHLVADLWSLGLVWNDLAARYAGGEPPAPLYRYADFVRWQRERIAGPEGERLAAYWRGELAGLPARLDLPTDHRRPPVRSTRGDETVLELDAGLSGRLSALAAERRATLQTVFQAAFGALLGRYSGQDDLAVGCPASGRTSAGFADVVGYFVNPVVLRVRLEGDPGFRELVDRVRPVALAALDHQEYPFPLLAQQLQPDRDAGSTPVFQALCAFQSVPRSAPAGLAAWALGLEGSPLELGPLAGESVRLPGAGAQFDLSLFLARSGGRIAALLRYSAGLWDGASMERLLRHFRSLLAAAVERPEEPLSTLPLLDPEERTQLLSGWARGAAAEALPDLCLHDLVEAQAERTPEAVAVSCGGEDLTYRELERRAAGLASWLADHLADQGVGPEARVGVLLPRTNDLIVAVLGVLKAGGAYVPLDPAYPEARLAFMLEDSGAGVLLCAERPAGEAFRSLLVATPGEWPREPGFIARRPAPGNLAYVIYTSGSTGRPKGVAIQHRSAVALVRWMVSAFPPEDLAGVLFSTSICFDVSVPEIFAPLATGGRVIVAGSALELHALPEAGEVTLVSSVPTVMAELLRQGPLPASVRTVALAGEPVPGGLVRQAYEGGAVRVLNLYGPTEDSTYSTCAEIPREARSEPAIGRPIAGGSVFVAGRDLEPAPLGIAGELLLGGRGLARGYWNRPDRTAERFIPDPFAGEPGSRLYRTGDLVRWRSDGELEFLGRIDSQVKLRGFRIELGEIEAALALHPGVAQCAVILREQRLVAWIVPFPGADVPDEMELRQLLAGRLPAYMVPAAFVPIDELPRTPSGKLDRTALARLAMPAAVRSGAGEEPRTPAEASLAGIWSDLLAVERVEREDDFFVLGGHSLLAVRLAVGVRETFGVELPLTEVFRHSTLAGMAARITASSEEALPVLPLGRVPREGDLPLSFGQRRLWFLDQLRPESPMYAMPGAFRLAGPLSIPRLRRAFGEIVRRHEVLRTTFPAPQGEPVQAVGDPGAGVPVVDLSGLPALLREAELGDLLAAGARRPFDLAWGPLLRAGVFRLGKTDHALALSLHHAVADGWSLGLLARELEALYGGEELPELPLQYADYAVWQRRWLDEGLLEDQLAYWREHLAELPEPLELPADRAPVGPGSGEGASLPFRIPQKPLTDLGRRTGTTPFMVLLAAYAALLGRYTGEDDLLVGAPVANRGQPGVQDLIGLFVNLLVLRIGLSGAPSVRDLLGRVREDTLAAYAQPDAPFEWLVTALNPSRDPYRSPFFNVVLAYGEAPGGGGLRLPGLRVEPVAIHGGTAKFDLTLSLSPVPEGGFAGDLEFSTERFDPATAARMLAHLSALLAGAVEAPGRRVSELPLLTDAESEQVLITWNRTARDYPRDSSIHALFAEQVRRNPQAVAVTCGGESLTYAELDRAAGRLAGLLRPDAGLDGLVGICLERSVELVVAILAVLKAGGAYVPLDPAYPKDRLAFLLADSGARVLITRRHFDLDVLEELGDPAPDVPVDPDNLAYLMYTSGSTGAPKGVAVTHRGVVRLVRPAGSLELGPGEVFLQLAPASFDASTFEIWGALLNGGRLAVPPPGPLSLEEIGRTVETQGVTTLFLTTGLFNQMVDAQLGRLGGVRQLLTGGETASAAHVRKVLERLPGTSLVHAYGPTENTTFTSCAVMTAPVGTTVPIGRPVPNTQVFLLDRSFEPVPVGIPGELCAAGDGLARGYLRRPDLTAERFIPNPHGDGERLYRTGDLARWRPDGQIEFLGRRDLQVKVRGYRIEPGEIEAALVRHPAVAAVAVVPLDDPPRGKRLVAWLVPREGCEAPAAGDLRSFLGGSLPEPMIPSDFAVLPELPLTRNGKVDRRALAAAAPEPSDHRDAGVPRTSYEELLAGIWTEVLGVDPIGPADDFFALGGHSLLATQAVSRIRSVFGVELPLAGLFAAPRLEDLAERIEGLREDGAAAVPPLVARPRGERPVLSFPQERLWFLDQLESGTAFYNIPVAARLEGPLRVEVLRACFAALVDRHETLRTTFADEAGRPYQVISPGIHVPMPLADLSGLPAGIGEQESRRLAAEEAQRPFDLARGPLVRLLLLRLGADEHTLVPTLHHVISDGWSMVVLIRELGELYRASPSSPLPPLSFQYADFALWQREHMAGEVLARQLGYWRGQLAGLRGFELPADRPRPAVETFRGAQHRFELPPGLAQEARALSRRSGVTLFMTLLAAFQTLLYRWTGHTDLAVGSPIANRNRREVEGLIGFLANTLVLRTRLAGDLPAGELLQRVREVSLGGYAHQELPFEKLVEELQPDRDMSRNPLFQVMLVLQNQPWPAFHIGEMRFSPLEVDSRTAKFDLTLFLRDERERLPVLLEYSTDLFDGATALRFYRQYEALLRALVQDPGAALLSLPLLEEAERHQIAVEWNPPGTEEWAGYCVHRRVEAQVARTPDAVAVIDGERRLTYAQLDATANRLARVLVRRGVGPESLVGICVERSLEMVVALLGVLKAGGALVALDPAYPLERLDSIIRDAGLAVLLTQAALLQRFPGHGGISLLLEPGQEIAAGESEETPNIPMDPDNPIYAIYTSGSTGQPKGILVTHRAFSNLLSWLLEGSGLRPGARTVQFSTFGFCVSFQEIFSSWCAGGLLVLADEMTRRDFAGLGDFLEEYGIERLHLPFAGLKQMAEEAAGRDVLPSSLKEVITAGEQLQVTPAVQRLFAGLPGCELHNQYGASETHVVSALRLAGDPGGWPAIPPIGRPVRNTRIHLLDPRLEPAAIGVPAELYAGGACGPRCYLNDPVLTAWKLLPDPYSPVPGARIYRTGDSARYLPDGRIEYHGRIDSQVKIRGYRVELGEIETVLRASPAVRDVAVVPAPGPGGIVRLVAYVVPSGVASEEDVVSFLRRRLPEPMIPTAFVELPGLPVNANGKLDREALPAPAGDPLEGRGRYVAPRDPVEEVLAGIWSRLLEVPAVGVFDNFFALGGHSLLATQLISRVRSAFQVQIPLRAVFEHPTVAGLARAVEAREPRPGHVRQIAGILLTVARMSESDVRLALEASR